MIRIGIIGCGYWGPNLVRIFTEIEGAELALVSDLRPGRLEFIARRYPNVRTTQCTEDVLSDTSIDAVVIATPPDTHHSLAVDALSRGKHLMVEKPLATTTADAESIVELAQRKLRTLLVGHLFLYAPSIVEVSSLLRTGQLGSLYSISSTRCNLGPPNTQIDVLWDIAPHDISMILHLMGDAPVEVKAYGACFTNRSFAETVFLILRFSDGRIAQIQVSWLTPAKTRIMQLICSRRVVVYDDMQPVQKVQIYDPGIDNRVNAGDKSSTALGFAPGGIWSPPLGGHEPLRAECEDFVASIQTGKTPVSDGIRALEVVRVLELATASLRDGGLSLYSGVESVRQLTTELSR